jgi:DNA repair protein RecN (Recombination protein N)
VISSLAIRNLAIVEDLACELEPGLNVFTGETGAGKSLVVDAISLLLGGRTQADLVGSHGETARVEASLEIAGEMPASLVELGLTPTLSLAREISRDGRSRARLNGRIVPLSLLRDALFPLLHLHGQQEHEALLQPLFQLDSLDRFSGAEALATRSRGEALRSGCAALRTRLAAWQSNQGERMRQLEVLRYELEEIERASPQEGEDRQLDQERDLLAGAVRVRVTLEGISARLHGEAEGQGLLDGLGLDSRSLQELAARFPTLASTSERLTGLMAELEDFSWELSSRLDKLEADPDRLETVEERLDLLARLKRKHGGSLEAVRAARDKLRLELGELEAAASRQAELVRELADKKAELAATLARLRVLRRESALRLAPLVEASLADLGIDRPRFTIELEEFPLEELRSEGLDRVEYLFSANPGEPVRPLARVASGGELSRLMLSLKAALAESDRATTLVFDEIDAGIGGRVGEMLARKLKEVSASHQVICVTHLPQIAALADAHFLLEKETIEISTRVTLRHLGRKERVEELGRMLGGSRVSEAVRQHAEELVEWLSA